MGGAVGSGAAVGDCYGDGLLREGRGWPGLGGCWNGAGVRECGGWALLSGPGFDGLLHFVGLDALARRLLDRGKGGGV